MFRKSKRRSVWSQKKESPEITQSHKRRLKWRFDWVWLALVLGCVIGISFIIWKDPGNWFVIRTIECSWQGKPCSTPIIALFESSKGEPILSFDTQQLERTLSQNNPEIKSLNVGKQLPDRLTAQFTIRAPIVLLIDGAGYPFLVDEGYMVFASKQETGLPKLYISEKLNVGQVIVHPREVAVLDLLKLLEASNLAVKEGIILDSGSIEIQIHGMPVVAFNTQKDLAKQVDALQFILGNSKMEEQEIKRIDLRFNNPVIR